MTDAGLRHLNGVASIRFLRLEGANVTDVGLDYLKGMTKLENLDLRGTHVTDAGIAKLKRAIPEVVIVM